MKIEDIKVKSRYWTFVPFASDKDNMPRCPWRCIVEEIFLSESRSIKVVLLKDTSYRFYEEAYLTPEQLFKTEEEAKQAYIAALEEWLSNEYKALNNIREHLNRIQSGDWTKSLE